jgi:hypothetical protein
MTKKGRLLVPATVPFWLKPASTLGLLSMTMFLERSPGFALPSILAPLRLCADRDIGPSRRRCQPVGCGCIVRRRCTSRYLPAHLRRIPLMGQRVVSWRNAKHNNDEDDFMSQPPVRPVRETFASYGSREKAMMGKVHFANSTARSPWSACAFAGYLCTVSRPSPSGPSPCTSLSYAQTPMAHVTACRASELAARVSPASFPLSFASLAGSPVFPVENAHEMLEVACSFLSLPRSGAPSSCSGGGQVSPYPLVRVPCSHAHRAYSCACGSPFQLDELTSQARSVRGLLTRRTMHASCASPWHLSAQPCVLETCLLLTGPFRAMLLTS